LLFLLPGLHRLGRFVQSLKSRYVFLAALINDFDSLFAKLRMSVLHDLLLLSGFLVSMLLLFLNLAFLFFIVVPLQESFKNFFTGLDLLRFWFHWFIRLFALFELGTLDKQV
jgi:hypothetical protein